MKQLMPRCVEITVGARDSSLSRAQVMEVQKQLPQSLFKPIFVKTYGDLNRLQSLRTLGKSDFFTKEIDEMLLKHECRIAIHSAKDLPEPLREGLALIALTKGLDSRDVLVMREGTSFEKLKKGSIIATSSIHREEVVKSLRSDLTFVDLRGTIEERIALLQKQEVDGVVVAECALIRLGMTHLNRLFLPGTTTPLQGRLAVVARSEDEEIKALLASFNR